MNTATLAAIAYGITSIAGGIFGYAQAKSRVSLILGSISGIFLIVAAWAQLQGLPIGSTIAQIITLLLVVVFTVRLIKTRKFMPAGLMLILGLITLVCLFL
ncbi:MAG: TMEM14 family protein [Xenococcaceae cyanobacterium MO_188.B29]|nr:TMEM14 family protein [Xenococcaceae cyanobacterium MO_188.B29]